MRNRTINASELRSFSFCERAWFLERSGHVSASTAERCRGISDHERHGIAAARAHVAGRLSRLLLAIGLAGAPKPVERYSRRHRMGLIDEWLPTRRRGRLRI